MDTEKVLAIAKNAGFSQVGELDCDTIRLMPEVRKMCEDNTCGMYGNAGPALRGAALWRSVRAESENIKKAFWCRPWVRWRIPWTLRP